MRGRGKVSARVSRDTGEIEPGGEEDLQHDDASTLAHDEAGAVAVEGPGRGAGVVVPFRRQAAGAREPGHGQRVDARFGATGQHHVGVAVGNEPRSIADRVQTGGARRRHGVVGPLQTVADGNVAGGKVDQQPRDEQGRDFARAAGGKGERGGVCFVEVPDAGADGDAGGFALGVGHGVPARVVEGFIGGDDGVLREEGHLVLVVGGEPVGCPPGAVACAIAVRDQTGDAAGEGVEVRASSRGRHDPAGGLNETFPRRFDPNTQWRDGSQSSDNNPVHFISGDGGEVSTLTP